MQEPPTRLKQARLLHGWTQPRVIKEMRLVAPTLRVKTRLPNDDALKTQLTRWENGRVTPGPDYRAVFRAIYGMTDTELGFPPLDEATLRSVSETPSLLTGDALTYFDILLEEHVRADNRMGPHVVLDVVQQQVRALTVAAREARGPARRAVIQRACRYHEFYGWLLQDAGRCQDAVIATDRARDFATELGDQPLVAYLLMRKSNIASDAADPGLAVGLANGALADGSHLPPRLRAVLYRQQANAYAGLGDSAECMTAIGKAFNALDRADSDDSELVNYCTPSYVAMEAANCWLELGQPGRALQVFTRASDEWDETLRRDHGLYLSRLALANALAPEPDLSQAVTLGIQAVTAATATRSARTIRHLRRLRAQLAPARTSADVAPLLTAVASLVSATGAKEG